MQKVATPEMPKCAMVAEHLQRPLTDTVKSIVVTAEPANEDKSAGIYLLMIRGDHELNEIKVGKLGGLEGGFRMATDDEIQTVFGCSPGYIGPVNPKAPVTIIADHTVANMSNFICGANENGFHLRYP